MENRAKLVIEVTAGVVPGTVEEEYTRKYVLDSNTWAEAMKREFGQADTLAQLNGQAMGYAGWLMMQPDHLNWVRTDWLWL